VPRSRRAGNQRVDIARHVDAEGARVCLLGAHVLGGPDNAALFREQGSFGQRLTDGLGDAEIDDLRYRLAVLHSDQDVRRLEVPVDDALLMGVVDGQRYLAKEAKPLTDPQVVPIAVLVDREPGHELHDEVGAALLGASSVEDLGDIRVVHQCQGLLLGFEAADRVLRTNTLLDDLERYLPPHRLVLFREVDNAHTARAKTTQDLVGADALRHDRGASRHTRRRPIFLVGRERRLLISVGHGISVRAGGAREWDLPTFRRRNQQGGDPHGRDRASLRSGSIGRWKPQRHPPCKDQC